MGRLRARCLAQEDVRVKGCLTDARGPNIRMLEWMVPEHVPLTDHQAAKREVRRGRDRASPRQVWWGSAMSNKVAPIPRLALTRDEAAAAIGMSLDSFERHVQPTIRLVRLGRMRLVPIREIVRWLDENAGRTLP
jgi:hypothetical protein